MRSGASTTGLPSSSSSLAAAGAGAGAAAAVGAGPKRILSVPPPPPLAEEEEDEEATPVCEGELCVERTCPFPMDTPLTVDMRRSEV